MSGLDKEAEVGALDDDSLGLTEEERQPFDMMGNEEEEDEKKEEQSDKEMDEGEEEKKKSKLDRDIEIDRIVCQNKLFLCQLEKVEEQIQDDSEDISAL